MDAPPVEYVTTADGHNIAFAVRGAGLPLLRLETFFDQIFEQIRVEINFRHKSQSEVYSSD